jgi:hypothetical protein
MIEINPYRSYDSEEKTLLSISILKMNKYRNETGGKFFSLRNEAVILKIVNSCCEGEKF